MTLTKRTQLSLIASAAALTLLAGCNRAEDNTTVGQKVDSGIAAVQEKTGQAADAVQDKSAQAADAIQQKADEAKTAAAPKAEEAGNAMENGAAKAGNAVENGAAKAADATADASLTAKVKTALMTAPELRSMKIDVDTQSGVVHLKGEVKSSKEKVQAEEVANKVAGVQSVVNDLRIQNG